MLKNNTQKTRSLLLFILFSAAALTIYSNSFMVPFHFDDWLTIVNNPHIKSLSNLDRIWLLDPSRFITYLSFAVNYHFTGLEVSAFHSVNACLHILTAFAVYLFIKVTAEKAAGLGYVDRKIGAYVPVSSALLFLVHPIQTQAVTYISQRSTLLAALCYVLSVLFYIYFKDQGKLRYYFLSLGIGFIGIFTKPIIVSLPIALVLYEIFFYKVSRKSFKKSALIIAPYFLLAMAVPFLLMYFKFKAVDPSLLYQVTMESERVGRREYLLTQFNVIITYFRLLILPFGQNLDYDFPIAKSLFAFPTWLSLTAILGVIFFAFKSYRKNKLVSFSIFWFFITIALESSIFPIADVINEHRLYLPMVGVSILIVYLILSVIKAHKIYVPVFTAIIITLSVITYQRNAVWADRVDFMVDVTNKSPQKARMFNNLGIAYADKGDYKKAREMYRKSIEISPDAIHGYNNLANTYYYAGNLKEARKYYEAAIRIDPGYAEAYMNLGNTYLAEGDVEKAEENFLKTIELKPTHFRAIATLGRLYIKSEDYKKALFYLHSAVYYNPGFSQGYAKLGDLYLNLGEYDKALENYKLAVKHNPKYITIYNSMANIYDMKGDYAEAAARYRKAISLKSDFANAYYNLANTLRKKGELEEAEITLRKAMELYEKQGNEKMVLSSEIRLEMLAENKGL